jgi:hypothetical protein
VGAPGDNCETGCDAIGTGVVERSSRAASIAGMPKSPTVGSCAMPMAMRSSGEAFGDEIDVVGAFAAAGLSA